MSEINKLKERYAQLGEKAEWIENYIGDCHWLEIMQKKQELVWNEIEKLKQQNENRN